MKSWAAKLKTHRPFVLLIIRKIRARYNIYKLYKGQFFEKDFFFLVQIIRENTIGERGVKEVGLFRSF